MKAFTSLVVLALSAFGMSASIERRQGSWGPYTCPTKQQCEASCQASGLVSVHATAKAQEYSD
ncbi:hypothetical protein BS50DRAFT_508568 [Corynespora cassiicola Philippines]|uniref:Uncharacterized protein n=1 Tax=Corynespora cassiicola Philippines TaxID=1448308 RepID=A0A2T2N1L5_CORCC|nr:hypothetical protein BS50DRAFT_508568 [Corynespora cassiicola Philippines]